MNRRLTQFVGGLCILALAAPLLVAAPGSGTLFGSDRLNLITIELIRREDNKEGQAIAWELLPET